MADYNEYSRVVVNVWGHSTFKTAKYNAPTLCDALEAQEALREVQTLSAIANSMS
jgi:hypothetical protein